MNKVASLLLGVTLVIFAFPSSAKNKVPKRIQEKVNKSLKVLETGKFSVNFENTSYKDAFGLMAKRLGLRLDLGAEVAGTVSYSFSNVTLREALDQISKDKDISYNVTADGYLSISNGWGGSSDSRSPASIGGGSKAMVIYLNYLTAQDARTKISSLLTDTDKVIIDGPTNSLAFFGSASNFKNIKDAIALFDRMPPQVLIEANVVEINRNDAKAYGFSYGDLSDPTLANVGSSSSVIKNGDPSAPNFAVQLGLGKIDGDVLSARLAMAESEGVAKILSSPKIVTINNVAATINSGITYTVKTLASSGSTDSSASVSGGVTQVSAGLTLSVKPTIVGGDQIKLNISVTNSEPDESTLVDGIPGIVNNSTNTEIIVGSGNTATVAGLIKHNNSNSESGVPYLSKVPIIGWLFKGVTENKRDKELMVFVTPKIIRKGLQGEYMSSSDDMRKHLKMEEEKQQRKKEVKKQ